MTTIQMFQQKYGHRWHEMLIHTINQLNAGAEHRAIARSLSMSEASFSRMLRRSFKIHFTLSRRMELEVASYLGAEHSYVNQQDHDYQQHVERHAELRETLTRYAGRSHLTLIQNPHGSDVRDGTDI
jgi:hypothetical protein